MNKSALVKLIGCSALASAVAACGGGNGSGSPTSTVVISPGSFESMFGSAFAALFDASPTTTASDPPASAIPALAPAGLPIAG